MCKLAVEVECKSCQQILSDVECIFAFFRGKRQPIINYNSVHRSINPEIKIYPAQLKNCVVSLDSLVKRILPWQPLNTLDIHRKLLYFK